MSNQQKAPITKIGFFGSDQKKLTELRKDLRSAMENGDKFDAIAIQGKIREAQEQPATA